MSDENDSWHKGDRPARGRRGLLKRGLGVAAVALSPVGTTVTSAKGTAQGEQHRFEIRAAEDVEFTYHVKAAGPVAPITGPEDASGAEPESEAADSVERLPDGTFHIEGTTGFGEVDRWEIVRIYGFWATTARDNYALFMDREEFEWYGLDTTLPPDFKLFEVRAAPGVETFEYEFTALTNATNVGSPADVAAELFESDCVIDRGETARVRGATGDGESDTWMIGWSPGDPDVAVTEFTTTASRDDYALFYDDREIAPDVVTKAN